MQVYLVVFDRNAFAISQKLYANIQAFIDDTYSGIERERLERRTRFSNCPRPAAARPAEAERPVPDAGRPMRKRKPLYAEDKAESAPSPAEDAVFSAMEAGYACAPEGLSEYLKKMDEGFRDMLLRKIDERKMTDAQCYKKANIDRKLFNKIKNQADYRPGKSTVLALAIALELPMDDIREMLGKAGFSLSHSSKFDLIVEYFLMKGNYDIYEINEALFSFDQKLLGSLQ